MKTRGVLILHICNFLLILKGDYVMEMNRLIKRIREKEGLSQSDVADGIMSRTSYSRFESGDRSISFDEVNKVMQKLKIHATDLNDLENLENGEIVLIRSKIFDMLTNKISIEEFVDLYKSVERKKDTSANLYRYYLYIRAHFYKNTKEIPQITSKEINQLFQELKSRKHWTNYYIQLIMDFTSEFNSEQIIYLLKRLESYQIEWISPIDSQYLYLLPGCFSNIADKLIDLAVLDKTTNKNSLLSEANRAANKLQEILEIRPSIEYELLLKLQRIRHAYYSATTKTSFEIAKIKAKEYLKDIKILKEMQNFEGRTLNTIPQIIEQALLNLLNTGIPGDTIIYYV